MIFAWKILAKISRIGQYDKEYKTRYLCSFQFFFTRITIKRVPLEVFFKDTFRMTESHTWTRNNSSLFLYERLLDEMPMVKWLGKGLLNLTIFLRLLLCLFYDLYCSLTGFSLLGDGMGVPQLAENFVILPQGKIHSVDSPHQFFIHLTKGSFPHLNNKFLVLTQ